MAIYGYTKNYKLIKPKYDTDTWHDYEYDNLDTIDAVLSAIYASGNWKGFWATNTAYVVGDVVIVVAKGICRAFDHLVAFLHGQKHGIHIHVHRAVLKVGKIALVGREPQLQISNLNAFRRIYEPDRTKDQENGKKKQKYLILLHNDYL